MKNFSVFFVHRVTDLRSRAFIHFSSSNTKLPFLGNLLENQLIVPTESEAIFWNVPEIPKLRHYWNMTMCNQLNALYKKRNQVLDRNNFNQSLNTDFMAYIWSRKWNSKLFVLMEKKLQTQLQLICNQL